MDVAWQNGIGARQEVGEHNAEHSIWRETFTHPANKAQRISDKVDRMRNMDHVVAGADIHVFKLPYTHANPALRMHRRRRRVGIDAFRIPAMGRKSANGLPKPTSNVDETAAA